MSNQKNIFPDEGFDFLIMNKKYKVNKEFDYTGLDSVMESHLNKIQN